MTDPRSVAARAKSQRERLAELFEAEIQRLVKGLVLMGATRVILFGSAARQGLPWLSSDLDILAVMASDRPFLDRVAGVYRDLKPRVAADILVYTPCEFSRLSKTSPFVARAVDEGVVLHEEVTS